MNKAALTFLVIFLGLQFGVHANASTDTTRHQSLFDLLVSEDDVLIHISEKVKTIEKNFKKELATEGTINVTVGSQQLSFAASFEPGGKTRRKICDNPPIKMDLKKSELNAQSFNKKCDKLKLVFQCASAKTKVEAIKKERFIYDLHALITTYGRRAELVNVKVADKDKEYVAILLEDDKDVDVRLDVERIKTGTIATTAINREEYAKMCLFQYMISNADWSARKGHNTELYKRNSDNSLIIVPYDFDYAGIINNDYAVAPENLPITKVTQRYFMGKDLSKAELNVAIDYFKGIEQDVYDLCDKSEYLSTGSRKNMKKFIEGFYKVIKNEKKVSKLLKK